MTTNHTVARASRKFRWTGSVSRIPECLRISNVSPTDPLSRGKLCIVAFRRGKQSSTPQLGVVKEMKTRISKKLADVPSLSNIDLLARCFVQVWFFQLKPRRGTLEHRLVREFYNDEQDVPPNVPVLLNVEGTFILYAFNHASFQVDGDWATLVLNGDENGVLADLFCDPSAFNAFCNMHITKSRQVACDE